MASLAVNVAGLDLRNPVMSASGTFGHGLEMAQFAPPRLLGALVSKTVTVRPRPGNPHPRVAETEAGLINSIGLENRGIEAYVREVLPRMADADTVVVTNIGAERVEEFGELAARLDGQGAVDALEINLSCPNVQGGRLPFATNPRMAEAVVRRVREATRKPIFAKLSPNVSDIAEIARAAESAGADGITAVNTLLGMSLDWRTGAPGVATVQGGYSGTGIKPVALRCAWACARAVSIPVVGCGGVARASDVLEYLVVGCRAVQVGTVCFSDPGCIARMPGEIEALLDAAGIAAVTDLIGTLKSPAELAAAPGAPS